MQDIKWVICQYSFVRMQVVLNNRSELKAELGEMWYTYVAMAKH